MTRVNVISLPNAATEPVIQTHSGRGRPPKKVVAIWRGRYLLNRKAYEADLVAKTLAGLAGVVATHQHVIDDFNTQIRKIQRAAIAPGQREALVLELLSDRFYCALRNEGVVFEK